MSVTLPAMAAPTRISPHKTALARARSDSPAGGSSRSVESRTTASSNTVITSRENHWLKTFRAAFRSTRPEGNRIALEGPHLVAEAIRSGLRIEAILASASGERHLPALQSALDSHTLILRTTDKLFDSLVSTETPQGIAALARVPEYKFEDLLHAADSLVIVLVAAQNPGNVGAILRSAEAFGATGIIATRGAAHPYSPKALRASSGSSLRLPILAELAPTIALTQLRISGLQILAASASQNPAARRPDELDLRAPFALLIGNEGAGLPPDIERSADALVRIQVAAPVESLNAAVAASLILYEAARQRRANA
ncbi:MAG TPA: RNA methyltransferase [Candidatus Acidoferrales bacterium]|nr:RNA methyltransferase [Candidatus Acidoferrales bacterium]